MKHENVEELIVEQFNRMVGKASADALRLDPEVIRGAAGNRSDSLGAQHRLRSDGSIYSAVGPNGRYRGMVPPANVGCIANAS